MGVGSSQNNLMCRAIKDKNWTKAEEVLSSARFKSLKINKYSKDEANVLHLAIVHDAPLDLIVKILKVGTAQGMNLNDEIRDWDVRVVLDDAIEHGKPEHVKVLLDHGADFSRGLRVVLDNLEPFKFYPPLYELDPVRARKVAVTILKHPSSDERGILRKLMDVIDLGLPIDVIEANIKDPKEFASLINLPLKDSIEKSDEQDFNHEKGSTVFHYACSVKDYPKENLEIIRFLLDHGADIHGKAAPHEWTPLHYAAHAGASLFTVQLLLERGADLSVMDINGKTPLHLAMKANEPHLFKILGGTETFPGLVPVEGN